MPRDPTPAPAGARARLGEGWAGERGLLPPPPRREAAAIQLRLRLLGDATPEKPWAAPAAPRIREHPRASPRTCIPRRGAGPGGGVCWGELKTGSRRRESLGKSRSQPQFSLQACPKGTRAATPFSPLAAPPIGSPLFSAIALLGRGRGCRALFLKGPLPFLPPGRSRARVGWGVPTGPRPPRPPSQLGSCSLSRRAGHTRRTPPPCMPQLPRPSWTP